MSYEKFIFKINGIRFNWHDIKHNIELIEFIYVT